MNKVIQQWNRKYEGNDLVFGSTPNEFLTKQTPHLPQKGHILCVGDGEGRNGVWLAEQGFKVHSVDGAINGVRKAIAQAEHRGVAGRFTGECYDLTRWDWPVDCYDGVACLHLYFMPNERTTLHHKMVRSLKEGGLFILEVFHPDNVGRNCGGPKLRELCYSADMLKDDFQDIADILMLEEAERTVAPSSFHSGGVGKVTRLVARRSPPLRQCCKRGFLCSKARQDKTNSLKKSLPLSSTMMKAGKHCGTSSPSSRNALLGLILQKRHNTL